MIRKENVNNVFNITESRPPILSYFEPLKPNIMMKNNFK